MQMKRRALTAVVTAVLGGALVAGPVVVEPATATPVPAARASVSEECAAAQSALAVAKWRQAAAHRKLVKARKALRKAKHTHRRPAIRKAKRHVKGAKARYAARTHNTRVQAARVGYACSAPNSSARAAGTGMKLDILAVATGEPNKVLDAGQLTTLLNQLLPGAGDQIALDPAKVSALLAGFNTGTPSLDDATVLLGSVFNHDQLTALLSGPSVDSTLVQTLTQNIIQALSGLSGVPVPSMDASSLQAVVDAVTATLGGLVTAVTGTTTGGATGGTTGGTGSGTLTCLPLVGCL